VVGGIVGRNLGAVRAGFLGAVRVQVERMILDLEAAFFGNQVLPALNFRIVEFLDLAAVDADQMVVVLAAVDLEHSLAGFEEVTLQQACLLELGQHAIDGGQTDVHVFGEQHAVDVFCRHVTHRALFEQLKNFQAGKGGFQADALEALRVAHRRDSCSFCEAGSVRISGMIYRFTVDTKLPEIRMRRSRSLLIVAACALLTACSYKPSFINEYKIDVQQGNVLTQDMVAQLKPGQSREQVRFILGSPLIADIFHRDRWDYVYRFREGRSGQVQSRKFSVFFDGNGLLERVSGDVELASVEELTMPVSKMRMVDLGSIGEDGAAEPLPPPEEPGFLRRMLNRIGL